MYKFLLALMMLFVVGCAANKSAANKPIPTATPFTTAEIGDDAALPEVDAVDDEAVEDLPDMVAAEN